jgi:hypothetical protein
MLIGSLWTSLGLRIIFFIIANWGTAPGTWHLSPAGARWFASSISLGLRCVPIVSVVHVVVQTVSLLPRVCQAATNTKLPSYPTTHLPNSPSCKWASG